MLRGTFPTVAPGTLYVRPSRRILGAEFGREELRHVAFACAALTLIFAGAFARGAGASLGSLGAAFLYFLPLAAMASAPAFFLAMVFQKRIALKEGCTTEFRIQPQWLIVSVLFAFLLGFVFAAPGSTTRFGNITRAGAGKMSAAVPLCYVGVGFAAILAMAATAQPGTGLLVSNGPVSVLGILIAQVCALLAAFSLIPVPGFPGADIWRWSKAYFVVIIFGVFALYVASHGLALV